MTVYQNQVNTKRARETEKSHTLKAINAMKIPTSLHLFEYLMLNEKSKRSSVVLSEQNWQAVVASGLVR